MAYTKRVGKFRSGLLRRLKALAKKGCGDGGWCECLLCRVMRVVQTEQFRNKPIHKRSTRSPRQPITPETNMVHWRGGLIEFASTHGSCVEAEKVAGPPWWAIKIQHRGHPKPYLWWLDYCGPPQIYLTRKAALHYAKQLREQYKCRVKVVKIGEL